MNHGKEEKPMDQAFSQAVTHMTPCYQCGTCASSCPVAKITEHFNPREVIRLSLLGERNEVISGDAIWLCCSCYNCHERCPQKVHIPHVLYMLRNIALREGHLPNIYSEFGSALWSNGRLVNVSRFVENKRPILGLPPLQPIGLEALRRILASKGLDKLQKKEEVQ